MQNDDFDDKMSRITFRVIGGVMVATGGYVLVIARTDPQAATGFQLMALGLGLIVFTFMRGENTS